MLRSQLDPFVIFADATVKPESFAFFIVYVISELGFGFCS
jgi:hypothetical protein